MPELPEVETVRRGLMRAMVGRRIAAGGRSTTGSGAIKGAGNFQFAPVQLTFEHFTGIQAEYRHGQRIGGAVAANYITIVLHGAIGGKHQTFQLVDDIAGL